MGVQSLPIMRYIFEKRILPLLWHNRCISPVSHRKKCVVKKTDWDWPGIIQTSRIMVFPCTPRNAQPKTHAMINWAWRWEFYWVRMRKYCRIMRSISSNLDNPCACLHIIISTTDQYGFQAVIRTLLAYPKLKSLYMKYSHCCDKIGASQLQVDQRKTGCDISKGDVRCYWENSSP